MAKATKKQALGRGLSALLNDPSNDIQSVKDKNADKVIGNIVELDIDFIEVNPFQPRTNFSEESLRELASSIKELGIIQPITVRKLGLNKYQLVSGERRFRASKLLALETIPALSQSTLIHTGDITCKRRSNKHEAAKFGQPIPMGRQVS